MTNPTSLDLWATFPFADDSEVVAAMSDPRYRDPFAEGYRDAVEHKLAISSSLGSQNRDLGRSNAVDLGESTLADINATIEAYGKATEGHPLALSPEDRRSRNEG